MKKNFFLFLIILFLTGIKLDAVAGHLMGGEISYEYIGIFGGQFRYKVKVKVYRCTQFCSSGNSMISDCSGADFRDPFYLGVYENDASKNLVNSVSLSTSFNFTRLEVSPLPPGDTCQFPMPVVCMEQGTYETDIDLPASTDGYLLVIQDCCRNNSMLNIVDPDPFSSSSAGMTWFARIPATTFQNNSPVFIDSIPVPYIPTGDTFDYSNIAIDPDGDILKYSFVQPYASNGNQLNGFPEDPLGWPIDTVEWQWGTGHNLQSLLGPNSYASISSSLGVAQFYLPDFTPSGPTDSARFYVVALQINEYRGGQLVGQTRRDIQLVFVKTPPNVPPNLAPNPDTGRVVRNFTITEGDSVCFPITYTDPDGKKLYLSGLNLPAGADFPQDSGFGTVTGKFCWNTNCNDTGTYYFIAKVTDNACPTIVIYETDTINVRSFTSTSIIGPDTSCANQPGDVYSINGSAGSTYQWLISGGTQGSGGNTNSITVNWGSIPGAAKVSVIETSADGCPADTVKKNVFLKAAAVVNAGTDLTFCSGLSGVFTGDSLAGYSYSWSPITGLSNSNIAHPTVKLFNATQIVDTNMYIKTASFNGCINKDTANVFVKPLPISNAGNDVEFCSGLSDTLGTATTSGYSYSWNPTTGLSGSTISNPIVTLSNGTVSPQIFSYKVTTTLNGCVTSDSALVTVNPLPTIVPSANPNPICFGDVTTLSVSGANTYWWADALLPTDTISQSSSFSDTPLVTTTYIVTGTDIKTCVNSNTITVTVNPLPNVQATATPDSACIGDTSTLTAINANTYSWAIMTSPGNSIGVGSSINVASDTSVSFIVTGTDVNTCVNVDTVLLTVNPKPVTNPIQGPPYACPGETGIDYWVVDTINSTFQWNVYGGILASGQGNSNIKVDWDSISGTGIISVVETNIFGCTGDSVSYSVNINTVLNPPAPVGLNSICEKEMKGQIYQSQYYTNGAIYTWSIVPPTAGNIITPNGNFSITVDWDTIGINAASLFFEEYNITVSDTCYGISGSLMISIFPSPKTSAISGDFSVCEGGMNEIYSVAGDPGSYFIWTVDNGVTFTGDSSNSIFVNWTTAGNYKITVVETNPANCNGDTITANVVVNPTPPTLSISGDSIVCSADTNISYTVNGLSGSAFNWTVGAGSIVSGNGTDNIMVKLGGTGTDTITVNEVTQFGCAGIPVSKIITLDNLSLQMQLVSDNFSDDTKIEVHWDLTDGQYFQGNYFLYRKTTTGDWQLLATVAVDSFEDVSLNTKQTIYEYLVKTTNLCGDTITTLNHLNILLLGTSNETDKTMKISWNKYINWQNGVKEYEIWRKLDNGTYAKETATNDTFMEFTDARKAFKHYFKIKAVENSTGKESWSNELMFEFKHAIDIPSAFTPNGDGTNDKWVIKDIDIYPDANVAIFNRWGSKVYSSPHGYNNDWDGGSLPDGTYFYVIELKSSGKEPKTGPVTIIR